MPTQQNFQNHTRFHPPFHFFLMPLLLANLILSIYYTIHLWPMGSRIGLWWIVMSFVWIVMAGLSREYALKAQDRTIRLEERLRYVTLLPTPQIEAANGLTLKQIIALRFASDAELSSLIDRTIAESLTPKHIKQSITHWRPDHTRI